MTLTSATTTTLACPCALRTLWPWLALTLLLNRFARLQIYHRERMLRNNRDITTDELMNVL